MLSRSGFVHNRTIDCWSILGQTVRYTHSIFFLRSRGTTLKSTEIPRKGSLPSFNSQAQGSSRFNASKLNLPSRPRASHPSRITQTTSSKPSTFCPNASKPFGPTKTLNWKEKTKLRLLQNKAETKKSNTKPTPFSKMSKNVPRTGSPLRQSHPASSGIKTKGSVKTKSKSKLSTTTTQSPAPSSISKTSSEKTDSPAPSVDSTVAVIPSPTTDMEAYFPILQAALSAATRQASALPATEDIVFHKSFDRSFAKQLDATSQKLLGMAGSLIDLAADIGKISAMPAGSAREKAIAENRKRKRLTEEDDAITHFDSQVQETLDSLLEQADINLDIVTGRRKAAAIAVKEVTRPALKVEAGGSKNGLATLSSDILFANIPKPQLKFSDRPNNSLDAQPWKPTLPHKHHAMVPLDYVPSPSTSRSNSPAPGSAEDVLAPLREGSPQHPYTYETKHLHWPSSLFTHCEPIQPRSFAATPFTFVQTPKELKAMVEKIKGEKEIAVDLEHHSHRSFGGFLCLMQISTRDEDFVVDLIKLRDEVRRDKLGGIMVDQSIVKVFHGAESDILWLQQDFDIYVVGLFDTYHATKVLHFVQHSLASLLKLYCDYEADKRYQMADWRIRPIPDEMMQYARSDTHFLLYVYDSLRNSLLERADGGQDLVRQVLIRSAQTATKIYEKPGYDFETGQGMGGWRSALYKKFGKKSSASSPEEYGQATDIAMWGSGLIAYQRERVFKRLHEWREKMARKEDESAGYIMSIMSLWTIVFRPFQSAQELKSNFRLNSYAALHADDIHRVVQAALEEGKTMHQAALSKAAKAVAAAEVSRQQSKSESSAVSAKTNSDDEKLLRPTGLSIAPIGNTLFDTSYEVSSSTPQNASTSTMFGDVFTKIQNGGKLPMGDPTLLQRVMAKLSPPSPVEEESENEEDDEQEDHVDVDADADTGHMMEVVEESSVPVPTVNPSPTPSTGSAGTKRKALAVEDKDDVVIVGKRNVKKAKKAAAAVSNQSASASVSTLTSPEPSTSSSETTTSKRAKKAAAAKSRSVIIPADIPDFDYANEPNQLDTFAAEDKIAAAKEKEERKKKKNAANAGAKGKKKEPVVDLSGFRKPPSNPSEIASGNKSRTF